jgi:hypothetical protein
MTTIGKKKKYIYVLHGPEACPIKKCISILGGNKPNLIKIIQQEII